MDDAYSAATRILVVYESGLPFGRLATFEERIEAMRNAVESLGLKETSSCDRSFKDIVRAAADLTA